MKSHNQPAKGDICRVLFGIEGKNPVSPLTIFSVSKTLESALRNEVAGKKSGEQGDCREQLFSRQEGKLAGSRNFHAGCVQA